MNIIRNSCATVLGAALLLLGFDVPAAAQASGVRVKLADTPVLRGQFEQNKHLQGFRGSLLSKGDFLLARDRGVIWNTRSPFASTIVLTKQRLLARQADGNTRIVGVDGKAPAVATMNALLMALLSGDIAVLSRQFDLKETTLSDGLWQLELAPKPGGLAKVFRRIVLRGTKHVESVQLQEASGDSTDIRFSLLRDSPALLSAEETKSFE